MIILPFVLWGMAREGGWDALWAFPLFFLALFAYAAAALAVLITIAWVITRVGALIPLRTKLYAAAAIWTAMMAALMALASFVTITLVIG